MTPAIILAYTFFFVAATASPIQRRWLSMRKNVSQEGQIQFASRVMLIVAVCGLILPLFNPFFIKGNIWQLVALAIICGIFGALFFYFSYTAQRHVEAGVSTIVNNIYTPVTIVLATLFLNERLSSLQIFGTSLLLVGMVVVSKKHRIGKFKFDKYFVMMLLSGVALGITLTAERALQKTTGLSAGTMISWWSQYLFLAITAILVKSKSYYTAKDTLVTGALRFLQSLSWVTLIFVVGNLSIVSAVTTFKVVIIFFVAAVLLKEREDIPRKLIGSFIALVGLLLMK